MVYKKKDKAEVQVIQSSDEQKRIMEMCHSDPTSGHFGVKKTFNQVREMFYWKGCSRMQKNWFVYTNSIIMHSSMVF